LLDLFLGVRLLALGVGMPSLWRDPPDVSMVVAMAFYIRYNLFELMPMSVKLEERQRVAKIEIVRPVVI